MKSRWLLFCLLLVMPTAVVAQNGLQPAMMPMTGGTDAIAGATARMVGAVLEYTHWPSARTTVRLCLAGPTRHAGRLGEIILSNGARLDLFSFAGPGAIPLDTCDALYIGRLDPAVLRTVIVQAHGLPVVTIAEDDPQCRGGAMFCLLYAAQSLSFQLNIDAVSRSAVRIDPRVLRLSKGGY